MQWLFFRQWENLKDYANEKGIKIVGDVPIFISFDSSDVWCNPQEFKLNADGSPKVVAGVPPDYFSATGQLWGNPIYDWDKMREDGFSWWISRVRATLKTVDVVRVDHFRGFAAAWEVPGGDTTAVNGQWVNVPGKELFNALKNALGELPFWAEDLGVITPDVEELRDGFGFPGMRILQFAFGGDTEKSRSAAQLYSKLLSPTPERTTTTRRSAGLIRGVGKGSTRDDSQIKKEHEFCLKYFDSDGEEIHWDFIRAVWSVVANSAIAPMQDLLGLGNEARMNLPASTNGNWNWQCKDGDFSDEIAERLLELDGNLRKDLATNKHEKNTKCLKLKNIQRETLNTSRAIN